MDVAEPQSLATEKRRSALSQHDVQTIFSQGTIAQPAPVEHISSRPTSSGVTDSSQQIGQAFPAASSQPVNRPNRFSLTFPILPPSKEESPTRRSISPAREASQQAAELVEIPADPSDGNFLTAIAAQERRVLEIKETLQRAETELDRLKLLWATHEAQKKKSESRKVTKLRPLSFALPSGTSLQEAASAMTWQQQQELERRRVLMAGPRASRGTVFSGSKHTRTLSLLTPVQKSSTPASPRPRRDTSPDKATDTDLLKTGHLPRAATTPDLSTDATKKADMKLDLAELGIDKDIVLNTGKKMAIGIKDGLWTFWEDLRQATVGEDAVQIIPPQHLRAQSSTQTIRSPRGRGSKGSLRGSSRGSNTSRKSADTKPAFTRSPSDKRSSPKRTEQMPKLPPLVDMSEPVRSTAETLPSPKRTPKTSSKHIKAPSVAVSTASSDAWDGWDDSPGFSRSSSATSHSTSHLSPAQEMQGTPSKLQQGVEAGPTSDPLPWPTLTKFPGATLRRTASHLLNEWDKLGDGVKVEGKDAAAVDASTRYKQSYTKQD